jgi:hypothetical protein
LRPVQRGSVPGAVNLVYLINYQPETAIPMTQLQGRVQKQLARIENKPLRIENNILAQPHILGSL